MRWGLVGGMLSPKNLNRLDAGLLDRGDTQLMRPRNRLRLVLMTRTGRPSGFEILSELISGGKQVVAVIAERRLKALGGQNPFQLFLCLLKKHGVRFLIRKLWEDLVLRRSPPMGRLCDRYGIPLLIVDDHHSQEVISALQHLKPDVLITANTRRLPSDIIQIPAKAAINFHTSKLPKYAGLDSIFWALYHGEIEIGVTIHYLKEGLDDGDIVLQDVIAVEDYDDENSLTKKANRLGARLMNEAIEQFENGKFDGTPQDLSQRTYFSWPSPAQRRAFRSRDTHANH
jgi:methionyl-tRNA formyltransferase